MTGRPGIPAGFFMPERWEVTGEAVYAGAPHTTVTIFPYISSNKTLQGLYDLINICNSRYLRAPWIYYRRNISNEGSRH